MSAPLPRRMRSCLGTAGPQLLLEIWLVVTQCPRSGGISGGGSSAVATSLAWQHLLSPNPGLEEAFLQHFGGTMMVLPTTAQAPTLPMCPSCNSCRIRATRGWCSALLAATHHAPAQDGAAWSSPSIHLVCKAGAPRD